MNEKQKCYLNNFFKSDDVVSDTLIDGVQRHLDFSLPKDYIEFMREFNGGEGEIGENSWLCLFTIEELINTNKNYRILMEQIPEYFLFGKDAADTGYAFHKKLETIHSFGLMSNFETDAIEFCGNNFWEFIEYLYKK